MSDYEREVTLAAAHITRHLSAQIDAGTFAGGAR